MAAFFKERSVTSFELHSNYTGPIQWKEQNGYPFRGIRSSSFHWIGPNYFGQELKWILIHLKFSDQELAFGISSANSCNFIIALAK